MNDRATKDEAARVWYERKRKTRFSNELGPSGRNRLWLYTASLDDPDPMVVYSAARGITQRFRYSQVDRSVWERAQRRLSKFRVDPETDEVLAVDPLFKARGGCRRGRPSKRELAYARVAGPAYEIAKLIEEAAGGLGKGG